MVTPNLGFITPVESQAQKSLTISNALKNIDDATQGATALTITGAKTVTAAEFTLGFSLELTGTPGAPFDLTIPSTKRFFRVENGTDDVATVKTASGTTVAVADGTTQLLYCDGANVSEEGGAGGGGSGDLAIEEEGSVVVAAATTIDFKGAGVTAVDDGGNQAGVTIPGVESQEGGTPVVAGTSVLNFAGAEFDVTDGGSGETDIALADQSLETRVQRITSVQNITGSPEQIQWNGETIDEFAGHDNSTDNERIVIGTNIVDVQATISLSSVAADAVTTARIVRFNSSDALQEVVAKTEAEENQKINLTAINVRGGAAGDYLVVDLDSTDSDIDVDLTGSFFLVRRALVAGGGGGGAVPTRTSVTLSGASTSVSIPAGCTRFRFTSEVVTMSAAGNELWAQLYHTGDTVAEEWGVNIAVITTSASISGITGNTLMGQAKGSSISKMMEGEVNAPRDAAKKTLAYTRNFSVSNSELQHRSSVANAANDDDTIRFTASGGTITGGVEIEWFFN